MLTWIICISMAFLQLNLLRLLIVAAAAAPPPRNLLPVAAAHLASRWRRWPWCVLHPNLPALSDPVPPLPLLHPCLTWRMSDPRSVPLRTSNISPGAERWVWRVFPPRVSNQKWCSVHLEKSGRGNVWLLTIVHKLVVNSTSYIPIVPWVRPLSLSSNFTS